MLRYVDDFFGVNRGDVQCSGGQVLTRICRCMGLSTDDAKDADMCVMMTLLGALVKIDDANACATSEVDPVEALKWSVSLAEIWARQECAWHVAQRRWPAAFPSPSPLRSTR